MGGIPTNHFAEVVNPKKRADGSIDYDTVVPGCVRAVPHHDNACLSLTKPCASIRHTNPQWIPIR
jgi:hypothetical protein